MTQFGWRYPIVDKGWVNARIHLERVNWTPGRAEHLFALIDSVFDSGADELLAVATSMHDLLVVPKPVPETTTDILRVCAPSHPDLADGMVRIMFIGLDSRITEIERPVSETLPLFWRFVDLEFGIKKAQTIPRK